MEDILVKKYREEAAELREQLEKANERVAELEELKNSLAYSEETGFIDLNNFAIEKQCKAIDAFASVFIESNYKHDVPALGRKYNEKMREAILNALRKAAEKTINQLRKEQENV